jgi:hypothetical protein
LKAPTGPGEENFLVMTDGELDDDGVAITTPLARNNCPEDFSKKICFHVTAGLEQDGLTRHHHDRQQKAFEISPSLDLVGMIHPLLARVLLGEGLIMSHETKLKIESVRDRN